MNDVLALKEKRAILWDKCKAFLKEHSVDGGVMSDEDFETYKSMESDVIKIGEEIEKMEMRKMERDPVPAYEFESAFCRTDRASSNLYELVIILSDICYSLTAESTNKLDKMPSAECYLQALEIVEKNSEMALNIARKIKTAISG